MATRLEKVSFHSSPKERQCQKWSNYHKFALISHARKVKLKILQAKLQYYMNWELPDVQANFRKAEEPEIKLWTSVRSSKMQVNSRGTTAFASLTSLKPLTTNCGKFLEMGISEHLTWLLRHLYVSQEAAVRTRHGTKDWFQTGKGVVKTVYCHLAYLTYMQSMSWEMLVWMKDKLKVKLQYFSHLLGRTESL